MSVGGVIDVVDLNFVGAAILPSLSKINPINQKDVARPVILTGAGFGSRNLKSKVKFGGVEATRIHSWTPTSIEVEPPYLSASVLVQVETSAGKSNYLAFQYLTKNLDVTFSLENPVDGFSNGEYLLNSTISTVPSSPNTEFTVTKDITVTNTTQTWYVLYVQKSGVVEGGLVGSAGELIGPGETLFIGRLTFQKNSSVRVYVDRDAFHVFPSVCRRNGYNCGTHALKIQTAQAVEMFWRMTVGSPIPVTDEAKLLFGAGIQTDVAWLDLANVVSKSMQGDLTALFALPDALIQILSSPAVIAILASYGYPITPSHVVALAIYRGSLVVRDLIQTLRAPHNGAIAFEAK